MRLCHEPLEELTRRHLRSEASSFFQRRIGSSIANQWADALWTRFFDEKTGFCPPALGLPLCLLHLSQSLSVMSGHWFLLKAATCFLA